MHFLSVAGMLKRIPDYPDAFHFFDNIATWGSKVSVFSLLLFFIVVLETLISPKMLVPSVFKKRIFFLKKVSNIYEKECR